MALELVESTPVVFFCDGECKVCFVLLLMLLLLLRCAAVAHSVACPNQSRMLPPLISLLKTRPGFTQGASFTPVSGCGDKECSKFGVPLVAKVLCESCTAEYGKVRGKSVGLPGRICVQGFWNCAL